MALLNAKPKAKRVPISLRVDEALLAEIKAYNEWAAIGRVDDFFDQAARFIFERDKDWQKKVVAEKSENP